MNLRPLILLLLIAIAAAMVAPMFGLLPPNGTVGIRIPYTTANATHWYLVHAVAGWLVFIGCVGGVLYLRRHPVAGYLSAAAAIALATVALIGMTMG